MSRTVAGVLAVLIWSAASSTEAQDSYPVILDMRARAQVVDRWLEVRLDEIVPDLMNEFGVDVWVVSSREYNEDPVTRTMLPATWLAARRRTILLFRRVDTGRIERLAISRYNVGDLFEGAWDPESQPDQWARLAELVAEFSPATIALNTSTTFALADGLTHTEHAAFMEALAPELRERVVGDERLAIGWLERRTAEEMNVYPTICRIAHEIIADGLSEEVIQPGVTTTADVEWWYRDRIRSLGLTTWFHPSVSVQREADAEEDGSFASREESTVISPGDLLHVDFGITYLRLNTDTQQHAYVLRPGESKAPAGLEAALAVGNRLQDILTDQFVASRTGNEILSAALDQAKREGIKATIYTHPIGFHGHGAGPTIGLWDQQGGVPGRGDYPLRPSTAHSIELNVAVRIPEWNDREIRIMLEEDAFFDGVATRYIDGRQTQLLLVPRPG